jgi:hypothetical protein
LQVLAFQVREFLQHIFEAVAARQILDDRFDGIAQMADGRLPVADVGIDCDPR